MPGFIKFSRISIFLCKFMAFSRPCKMEGCLCGVGPLVYACM